MHTPKTAILHIVEEARQNGRRVGDVRDQTGIYDRWKKRASHGSSSSRRGYPVLPEEQHWIDEVKTAHPGYRHRRIQGGIAGGGALCVRFDDLSSSEKTGPSGAVYSAGSPWKHPRYEIRHRKLLWGGDWTKLSIG